jgi:single-strand DNA-binding protein
MNDLTVTVTGWVATDPKLHVVPNGADLVSFRLASTSRYFDRANNSWVDRDTEWFTVRVFRAAALLVERSIRKGQPIVVVGRLHTNEWTADSGQRTDLVIDAQTVGHDLTRGVGEFTRAVVDAGPATAQEPAAEAPIEEAEVEVPEEEAAEAAEEKALEPAPF